MGSSPDDVGEVLVTVHSPTLPFTSPTSQLILQTFRCFTYVIAHSLNLPLLYLRHSSFSKPSVALPKTQLILQTFRCFTYVAAHSPTLPFTSPTSQLILQPFRSLHIRQSSLSNFSVHFTYVTAHSPNLPLLLLHHSSFSNPSFASPTSQALHLIHLASRPWPWYVNASL